MYGAASCLMGGKSNEYFSLCARTKDEVFKDGALFGFPVGSLKFVIVGVNDLDITLCWGFLFCSSFHFFFHSL